MPPRPSPRAHRRSCSADAARLRGHEGSLGRIFCAQLTTILDSADFGDPTSTDGYTLCAFDEGTELFRSTINPGGTCGTLPCWRAMNSGYKYIDRDRTPDGMLKTLLKAGATGKVPGRRAADGLPVQVAHITTGPLIDTVEVFKSTAEVPLP